MFAGDFGVGQVLWSMIWFVLFFMWIMIVINVFMDIVRDRNLGGVAKALWTFFVIFLPYLGVFVYLIVRGRGMSERSVKQVQKEEQAFRDYVQSAAGANPAQQIATLSELLEKGKITEAEFATLKQKALQG
jgi:hypothetical protein